MRRAVLALCTLALLCVLGPAAVSAQAAPAATAPPSGALPTETGTTDKPAGFRVDRNQAERIAGRDAKVREAQRGRIPLVRQATVEDRHWKVSFFRRNAEVVQVLVDGPTGAVTESWNSYQVAWKMARGYEGAFGRSVNAPYVWLPLCAIFFLAFFDWRRPLRVVHLDLLVLLSFGISHAFFNAAETNVSVPLTYPPLLYLLGRLLWIGFRGRGPGLRPAWPPVVLIVVGLLVIGGRIGLNIADSNVIDVGYSGVIGADKITHGHPVYGQFPGDDPSGDTYGPLNYYAYVPFEQAWPWSGRWDDLPAAHGAAVAFDLLAMLGLLALGRRLRSGDRGWQLGGALAFSWAAYPYTAFVLESNANDALVAALVIWALVAASRPLLRGAGLALAVSAKLAPLVLAPLLATWRDPALPERPGVGGWLRDRATGVALFSVAFAVVTAGLLVQAALDPGLSVFVERTISFQAGRDTPFAIWNLWGGVGPLDLPGMRGLQIAVLVGAIALALAVAVVPQRRSLFQLAALAGAVLIAFQLSLEYWFYLYIVWFFPLVMVALATPGDPEPAAAADASSGGPERRVVEVDTAAPARGGAPGEGRDAAPQRPSRQPATA